MNYFPATIGSEKVIIDGVKVRDKTTLMSTYAKEIHFNDTASKRGSKVMYNGELHAIGSSSYDTSYRVEFYKWNCKTWTRLPDVPYAFLPSIGDVVVYGGCIHILGGSEATGGKKYHYKWNGETWTQLENLPIEIRKAGVYHDELHVLSTGSHYKWDGETWTACASLDNFYGLIASNNDMLYVLMNDVNSNNNVYSWNGTSWLSAPSITTSFACAVMSDSGVIHALGGNQNANQQRSHYYLRKPWTYWSAYPQLPIDMPNNDRSTAVADGESIHIFDGTYTYHWALDMDLYLNKKLLDRVELSTSVYFSNVPFSYRNLLKAYYTDGSEENIDAISCNIPSGTILQEGGPVSVTASFMEGGLTKTVTGTINVIASIPWSSGSVEDINKVVKLMDDGVFTPQQIGWQVGDVRTVHLSAMDATNVGESHVEQDVNLVIMNVGGKTLANGNTCNFVVGQKEPLIEEGYMYKTKPTTATWFGSNRRTWCNNQYRNAFPENIRGIFKQFKNTGYLGSDTEDYFALPSDREVTGTGDVSTDTWFEFYKTADNRKKSIGWWTRTPINAGGQSDFYGTEIYVNTAGNTTSIVSSMSTFDKGIVPFGCI